MKIPPISPGTKFFNHPVAKADFASRKDRLPGNQLEPKDRVTISPDARIQGLRKQAAPPDPEPIMAKQSKLRKLLEIMNDNPWREALIKTLAEREEWEAIKTALHRKGDKETDSIFNRRLP